MRKITLAVATSLLLNLPAQAENLHDVYKTAANNDPFDDEIGVFG